MEDIITIDRFNKLTGQETLHPLVGLVDLSANRLREDVCRPCDFYALICRAVREEPLTSLRLINPGEMFRLPSMSHREAGGYAGVLFHPALLCDTPLEHHIADYPKRCSCCSRLSEHERHIIFASLQEIDKELHHAIDRHSSTIIVSHIELLLNYCTRFCSIRGKMQSDKSVRKIS